MPCNSDHMAPTERERARKHAATLLIFVRNETGTPVEPWVLEDSNGAYPLDDRSYVELCRTLREMEPSDRDLLLYKDAHNRMRRDLATWWEEHLEDDRRREEHEREQARREAEARDAKAKQEALLQSARDKLTPEELEAVKKS